MRQFAVLAASVGVLSASMVAAQADEGPPPHGHLMINGIESDSEGNPVGFKNCHFVANGRALPLHAHHETIHTGQAGAAISSSGRNVVLPLAPLSPFEDCDDVVEFLEGGGGQE